jgi:hypothetical protein
MKVKEGALQSETQESPYDKELPPTAACATARSWQNEIINPGKDSLPQLFLPLTQQVVFQSWYYLLT